MNDADGSHSCHSTQQAISSNELEDPGAQKALRVTFDKPADLPALS